MNSQLALRVNSYRDGEREPIDNLKADLLKFTAGVSNLGFRSVWWQFQKEMCES